MSKRDHYRCRVYEGTFDESKGSIALPGIGPQVLEGDYIIHAAAIVSNQEFMNTACNKSSGHNGIFEAPRDWPVTCLRCIAFGCG